MTLCIKKSFASLLSVEENITKTNCELSTEDKLVQAAVIVSLTFMFIGIVGCCCIMRYKFTVWKDRRSRREQEAIPLQPLIDTNPNPTFLPFKPRNCMKPERI